METDSRVGGTSLTGPVEGWRHPDAYWSRAFASELATAQVEQRAVVCPVCSQPNGSVRTDTIGSVRPDETGLFQEFAGGVGALVTLEGCGHTIKR